MLATGIGGLLLLSLPAVSGLLLVTLESDLPTSSNIGNPPQAIIILTGDVARGAGALDVGALILQRERAGAALHRRIGLPNPCDRRNARRRPADAWQPHGPEFGYIVAKVFRHHADLAIIP
ncbi:hypothetical protein [Rhodopila globiformis]|uniref:hypothetical protein n=1 Tax=Rhodopila globiformis TaxID=1071 RepID=UPI0011B0D6D2|nr:hypothetical protein [Rhodopila globiformis]